MLVLLGIAVVVAGFVARINPLLVILIAAIVTGVTAAVDGDSERLQKIFIDLHQHPELSFMETRTAGIVAKELKALIDNGELGRLLTNRS